MMCAAWCIGLRPFEVLWVYLEPLVPEHQADSFHPNGSLPLSLDHITSQVSSNGQTTKSFTAKSIPQINPRVFRSRRHGNLAYMLGTSGMGNRALTAQPVISSERRASRRPTASARRDCLVRRGESILMAIDNQLPKEWEPSRFAAL
jgi:hypothetical protein